ncbi:unnamed protein product [Discula destructiva]
MGSTEPLHVLIVGAGFCGLACAIACREQGFKVTVFEQATRLPPGDSISFGSNATKLFRRWGIYDSLFALSGRINNIVAHNWDGTVLGTDPSWGEAQQKYGLRGIFGHRGKFHDIFLEEALKRGADVRFSSRVKDYDIEKPSIILESGEEIVGDAVVASDGVKSIGREKVLGYWDRPIHSGYATYRAMMDAAPFRADPVTKCFFDSPDEDQMHVWVGPDLHGLVLTVQNGKYINAVFTHKDVGDVEEGWSFPGKKEDVLEIIKGWDPVLTSVWEKASNLVDWKLVYRPCLDEFVTESGLVAIAGDAAHPFLPTSAQGASQGIEDGATIALCLAKAGKGRVPVAFKTYFEIRHEYVKTAQSAGLRQREIWHNMHDKDTLQVTKDLNFEGGLLESQYLWANECEQVVHDKWDEVSAMVEAEIRSKAVKSTES